jgi:hypothetical protein
MPYIYDMGPTVLLPLSKEGVLRIFSHQARLLLRDRK